MKLEDIDQIKIDRKKLNYPLNPVVLSYIDKYNRTLKLSIVYNDLLRMFDALPIMDANGENTHWFKAMYSPNEADDINEQLIHIYSILKSGGNYDVHKHLTIESIDYCAFGNSNPFRIKIVNKFNDVYDYFYVKKPDASRIFGLELEHILSPSRINYFANKNILVEEHIIGIPGDLFVTNYLQTFKFNKKRLAKEFVKFNERCLIRLLGDMRSYNFVIDMTYDFDDIQFRLRAIDFDQQSYEGNHRIYIPQFFKENFEYVNLAIDSLNNDVINQYKQEERSLMAMRIISSKHRLIDLINALKKTEISPAEHVSELKVGLANYYNDEKFLHANSMADILEQSLRRVVEDNK